MAPRPKMKARPAPQPPADDMPIQRLPNAPIKPLTPEQQAELRKKQAIRKNPTTSI